MIPIIVSSIVSYQQYIKLKKKKMFMAPSQGRTYRYLKLYWFFITRMILCKRFYIIRATISVSQKVKNNHFREDPI